MDDQHKAMVGCWFRIILFFFIGFLIFPIFTGVILGLLIIGVTYSHFETKKMMRLIPEVFKDRSEWLTSYDIYERIQEKTGKNQSIASVLTGCILLVKTGDLEEELRVYEGEREFRKGEEIIHYRLINGGRRVKEFKFKPLDVISRWLPKPVLQPA